ncbi:MAG: hypothetical protein AAF961_05175, partial [Planctomycetota bacterium]
MASINVAEERIETLRSLGARRRYRRGLALGAVGGVAITLLGALLMNPAITDLIRSLASSSARSSEESGDGESSTGGDGRNADSSPDAALAAKDDNQDDDKEGDAPEKLAGAAQQAGAAGAKRGAGGSPGVSGEYAADATAAINVLATELREFSRQFATRLDRLEQNARDASVEEAIAVWREQMTDKVTDLDQRVGTLDVIAEDYEKLVNNDLPELRRAIGQWKETIFREESTTRPGLDQSQPTTEVAKRIGAIDGESGTLL